MVYPVHKAVLKVGTAGRSSSPTQMAIIKDIEKMDIELDETTAEWMTLNDYGWTRRLKTAKSLTVSCGGKRNYGDTGSDYIASVATGDVDAGMSIATIELPDGGKLTIPCVIEVEEFGGGGADDVGRLSFKCKSDGRTTYSKTA